ncbi:MAG: 2'-5' RNA ligase family protein [Gemmatimonadaceae bacterium]
MTSSIDLELAEDWRQPPGIFVIAEVGGVVGAQIRDIQRRYDPKLANSLPPHITIAGSSGVGPIPAAIGVQELRDRLEPICKSTPPLTLSLQKPHRFMQTDIVVLPLDPHGPLRSLHERIAGSGLPFARPRFSFTPHITLSFYRTLEPRDARQLLALRIDEPVVVDALRCSLTNEPLPPRTLIELQLGVRPS